MRNNKKTALPLPVERHDTAAWRGHTKQVQPTSNVGIPCAIQVRDAKEWVDSNQK
ncbi:MAG: DUF3787 domain-containing protein [Peptococcaceae bacterium]|nr:DUF3787 domain-containing protein [Peptococcaceae bacterium]